MSIPEFETEGHYWARWIKASQGTADGGESAGEWADWEVVFVFDNHGDGDEAFRVFVPGVEKSQHIANFDWGPKVEPFQQPTGARS